MMRTLTLFLYYIRWQRTMAWTSGIGAGIMALSFVLPPAGDFFVIMLGGGLALGFPVTFAGVAFRQLISHPRLLLIPDLRFFAACALLLLALVCSTLAFVWIRTAEGRFPGGVQPDPIAVASATFFLVSSYLLITQWLATYLLGLFSLFLLPVVMLRFFLDESVSARVLAEPWPVAALAVAGWIWLFATTRKPARPKPLAIPRWQLGLSEATDTMPVAPRSGTVATAAGTLMRGFGDSFRSRLTGALTGLVLLPAAMVLLLWVIRTAFDASADRFQSPIFFLLWSLIMGSLLATQWLREWPARLRYLWLRHPGDRLGAWQLLERTMLREVSLITVVAAVIAIPFGLLAVVDTRLLALYVLGCGALATLSAYFGFLTRIAGWPGIVHALFFGLLLLLCYGVAASVRDIDAISRLYAVLGALAVLTVTFRTVARRRLLSIDWCAVRPAKVVRAGLIR